MRCDLSRQSCNDGVPVCWRFRCGLCCTAANVILRVLPAGDLFGLVVSVAAVEPPFRINLVVKARRVKISGKWGQGGTMKTQCVQAISAGYARKALQLMD